MPVRKIPKNYRNITGVAAHSKASGIAAYESSLERDFLSLVEFSADVTKFEVQPVSIEWIDPSGKKHTYVPDVLVHYKQSRHTKTVILYEIKYRKDLKKNWLTFKPKFKAAIAYCKARGWKFKLVTEVEVHTVYLENVRFLQSYVAQAVLCEHFESYMTMLDEHMIRLKTATPNSLLSAVFEDEWNRAKLLPTLWYLIGTFQIGIDLNQALTMQSKLWSLR